MFVAWLVLAFKAADVPATTVDLDELSSPPAKHVAGVRGLGRSVKVAEELDTSGAFRVATEVVDPQWLILEAIRPLRLTVGTDGPDAALRCDGELVAEQLRLEELKRFDPDALTGMRLRQEGSFGAAESQGLRDALAVEPRGIEAWATVAILDYDVEPTVFGTRRYHVSPSEEVFALQLAPGASYLSPSPATELNFVDPRDQLLRGQYGSVRLSAPLPAPARMALEASKGSSCVLEQFSGEDTIAIAPSEPTVG